MSDAVEWAIHCCTVLAALPDDRRSRRPGWPSSTTCRPPTWPRPCRPGRRRDHRVAPGPRGGYRLARPPAEITLLDIVLAVDGDGTAFRCSEIRQRGPAASREPGAYRRPCGIARAMWRAEDAWRAELAATTVGDIVVELMAPSRAGAARARARVDPGGPRTTEEQNMKIFLAGGTGVRRHARPARARGGRPRGHGGGRGAREGGAASASLGGDARHRRPVRRRRRWQAAVAATRPWSTSPRASRRSPRRPGGGWATNERLRTRGVEPPRRRRAARRRRALRAGVDRFPYVDGGDRVDRRGPPRRARRALRRRRATPRPPRPRFTDGGGIGVVLRFAQFYAARQPHARSFNAGAAQAARTRSSAPPDAYASFIHAEDAGSAVGRRAAMRRPAPTTSSTTSRSPAPRPAAAVAEALGVKPPKTIPDAVPRPAAVDGQAPHALAAGVATPASGTPPAGPRPTRRSAGSLAQAMTHDPLRQVALVVIAGGEPRGRACGPRRFPRSFYDDFPGAGRTWVAVDGPYNEHLVRDVGGLNLALAFVAVLAARHRQHPASPASPVAPRCIYGVPHLAVPRHPPRPLRHRRRRSPCVSLALVVLPPSSLGAGLARDDPPSSAAGLSGRDPSDPRGQRNCGATCSMMGRGGRGGSGPCRG